MVPVLGLEAVVATIETTRAARSAVLAMVPRTRSTRRSLGARTS